jgi:hypothetical protein
MSTGGSGQNVGGIYAELGLDTSQLQAGLDAADARMKQAAQEIRALIAQLQAGQLPAKEFGVAFAKASSEFNAAGAQLKGFEVALGRTTGAMSTAAAGAGRYQQNITALTYGIQDFLSASGGIAQRLNAISNNLPMILAGFGGWGLALSALVPVIGLVIHNWDGILRSFQEKNPFPRAADDVSGLKKELDRARDAMSALEKHASLTNDELEKYNGLRATAARLEKEIADSTERQAKHRRLAEAPREAEAERAQEMTRAVAELGGPGRAGQDAIVSGIAASLRQRSKERIEDLTKQIAEVVPQAQAAGPGQKAAIERLNELRGQVTGERARQAQGPAGFMDQAKDIANKAIGQGNQGLLDLIKAMAERAPQLFPEGTARVVAGLGMTPGRRKEQEAADLAADAEERAMADERRRRSIELGKELTAQGRENQEALLEDRRREAREAIPAVGEWAARASRRLPAPEVARQIGEALAEMGYSDAEAKPVAKSLALEGERAAKQEAMERVLNPPKARVLDMDIAWGIQGAAAAGMEGIGKETNSLLKAIAKSNDKIADAIARQRAPRFEKVL